MSENGWQRFSSTNYDVTEPIMVDAFYQNIMMLEFSNNMLIAAIEILTGRWSRYSGLVDRNRLVTERRNEIMEWLRLYSMVFFGGAQNKH